MNTNREIIAGTPKENTVAAARIDLKYCANNHICDVSVVAKVTSKIDPSHDFAPGTAGKTLNRFAEKKYPSGANRAMKLYTFSVNQHRRAGTEWQGQMVDLAAAYSAAVFASGSDESIRSLPQALLTYVRIGPAAIAAAQLGLDFAKKRRAVPVGEELVFPRDEVRIHAPLARPGKIICSQASEGEGSDPLIHLKLPNCIVGPGDPVIKPAGADELEAEFRVAAVISQAVKNAAEAEALASIFGYTLMNDLSVARNMFKGENRILLGRNLDTFCPLGPSLVTADEIPEHSELEFRSMVNNEIFMRGRVRSLPVTLARVVSRISRHITLEPGDLVAIAPCEKGKPLLLKAGDEVKFEMDTLGCLESRVDG